MAVLSASDYLLPRGAEDHSVVLAGVTWDDYERLLEIRGEAAVPRMTYLRGVLELTSPSLSHLRIKTTLARLIEAYALTEDIELCGYGSWTVRDEAEERGAEADECYVLGAHEPERPDLAIEVVWTSWSVNKLDVWRGLGVREVWIWRDSRLQICSLSDEGYVAVARSAFLPELDPAWLTRFAERTDQTQATREFLALVRAQSA